MSDVGAGARRGRALPGHLRGAAAGRVGAAAQHGLDGRQPVPARALRLLPRRRLAVQQARARHRLLGARGLNRGHAILGTSEHCIATHPSDVAVALVAFDAVVHTIGPERRAGDRDRRLLPAARRHAGRRAPARARRADRGDRGAAAGAGAALAVPQVPRPRVLRVRARVGRRRAATSQDGAVADVRLALGGVATKPWRARRAEARWSARPPPPSRSPPPRRPS